MHGAAAFSLAHLHDRAYRLTAVFLFLLLFLPSSAYAVSREEADAFGIGSVEAEAPPQVGEILGDISVTDALAPEGLLSKLWDNITAGFSAHVKKAAHSAVIIVIVVLLCAMAGTMYQGSVPDLVPLGGTLAVSAVAVGDMNSLFGLGTEMLASLTDFSRILMPSLAAAASASGAVSSAAAKYAAVTLFMDILMSVSQNVIMPLIYAYVALIIANAAMGNGALAGTASLLKWLCVTSMTILVITFAGYLSITGVISGSADAVATRVAKTTMSTLLPVVGSIISDAAGTVVVGAGLLRNAVGVFGMICVLCVCAAPFVKLGIQYLLYKAAGGLSCAFADGRLSGLISGIGTAFGMVLSLVGAGAIMMFFSLISFMKAVTGA